VYFLLARLLLQTRSTLVWVQVSSLQEGLHHSGMMLLSVFITASLFAYCSNLHHLSGVLHIFHRSALLSYSKNLLFRNAYTTKDDIIALLTARSLDYCCNLEALLAWYKYLLRNAYTTAGRALLRSRNGLFA
jgi:hypothetical protein